MMDAWHLLLAAAVLWLLCACVTLAWAVVILTYDGSKARRIIPSAFILGPLGPLVFLLLTRTKEPNQ